MAKEQHPQLRTHKLDLEAYDKAGMSLEKTTLIINESPAQNIFTDILKVQDPEFLMVNSGDWANIKLILNEQ